MIEITGIKLFDAIIGKKSKHPSLLLIVSDLETWRCVTKMLYPGQSVRARDLLTIERGGKKGKSSENIPACCKITEIVLFNSV